MYIVFNAKVAGKKTKKIMAMEKITKQSLISLVKDLNGIINNINYENCYDMVVKFFGLTSTLEDNLSEIGKLPIKCVHIHRLAGFVIFGFKSKARKKSEETRREAEEKNKRIESHRDFFFKEVRKAGRDPYGRNRTKPGEQVTKHNVYFGDTDGIWTSTVAKFEECEDSSVQKVIRRQIVEFVQSYKNSFHLEWLK